MGESGRPGLTASHNTCVVNDFGRAGQAARATFGSWQTGRRRAVRVWQRAPAHEPKAFGRSTASERELVI